jgi:hypothetical protein
MFAHHMKWDDLVGERTSLRRLQLQLTMYAQHLFTGQSLQFRRIKLGTIKDYVRAAATFMQLFSSRKFDPRYDGPLETKVGKLLSEVYKDMQKYEELPRKREPFGPEMLELARKLALEDNRPDGLLACLADWYVIGLNAGLRKSEWAQPENKQYKPSDYQKDVFGNARAFTINDIRVEDGSRRRFRGFACLKLSPNEVRQMWITFRTQKNGNNGEQRLFTRVVKDGRRCFVQAMYRILGRFQRLRGTEDVVTPLALYKHTDGSVRLVTPNKIEHNMRLLASRVFGLDPIKNKKDLALWASHSIRVGACVLLHTQGYNGTQLQWLLRWRSDAFMAYLRNLPVLADQQARVLDTAVGNMPQFL